jgi:hypothetical protein
MERNSINDSNIKYDVDDTQRLPITYRLLPLEAGSMESLNPDEEVQISTTRIKRRIRDALNREAAQRKTTLNSVVADACAEHVAERSLPPEIRALAELIAQAMHETGTTITQVNRWGGHPAGFWLSDTYAFDQAAKAALRVIHLARPDGSRAPHGLFASGDLKQHAATIGRQIADGIILQLDPDKDLGPDATRLPWIERISRQLGAIGDRLKARREPMQYFLSSQPDPNPKIEIRDGMILVQSSDDSAKA